MLPSAIDDEPAINVFNLLDYWVEEPPAHVTLALRYLGQRRRRPLNEQDALGQLAEAGQLMGQNATALPPEKRALIEYAEEMNAKLRKNGRKS